MPIYCTRWEHRALYNNTNDTHTDTCASDEGIGMAMKNCLEIVIERVRLEGGFNRGGRIRVAECLRQTVPNRWASQCKKMIFHHAKDSAVHFRAWWAASMH